LRDRELTTDTRNGIHSVVIGDDAELLEVLADNFDLVLPAGTRFVFLEQNH
jgi:hypothetical protein